MTADMHQADLAFAAQEADTIARRLEHDRHEADKVLTYVLDLRRLATELEHRADSKFGSVRRDAVELAYEALKARWPEDTHAELRKDAEAVVAALGAVEEKGTVFPSGWPNGTEQG
jgi:hypothetical protein